MSRNEPTLDPQMAAELAQLDAALAGAPIDDTELEALVRDVRALGPAIAPTFRAHLEREVAAGFPRPRRFAALADRWAGARRRPALIPALGVAASALVGVIVVVAVSAGGSDRATVGSAVSGDAGAARQSLPAAEATDSAGGGSSASGGEVASAPAESLADRAQVAPDTTADKAIAPAPTTPDSEAPNAQRRKVERSATLTLTTSASGLQDASDGVVRVTQDLGGYVASSQVNSNDRGGTASFRLRVPSARLDEAIARLSKLAHVRSLDQAATDITGPTASTTDRLLDARAERRGLQRALAKATNADEIAQLRAQLRVATNRVGVLQAELDALRRRADLSTVDVTLTGRGAAREEPGGGGWTPGDAGRDALRVLEVCASVALIALAVAVPLGLLIALGLAVARNARRRRREAALDVL